VHSRGGHGRCPQLKTLLFPDVPSGSRRRGRGRRSKAKGKRKEAADFKRAKWRSAVEIDRNTGHTASDIQ